MGFGTGSGLGGGVAILPRGDANSARAIHGTPTPTPMHRLLHVTSRSFPTPRAVPSIHILILGSLAGPSGYTHTHTHTLCWPRHLRNLGAEPPPPCSNPCTTTVYHVLNFGTGTSMTSWITVYAPRRRLALSTPSDLSLCMAVSSRRWLCEKQFHIRTAEECGFDETQTNPAPRPQIKLRLANSLYAQLSLLYRTNVRS